MCAQCLVFVKSDAGKSTGYRHRSSCIAGESVHAPLNLWIAAAIKEGGTRLIIGFVLHRAGLLRQPRLGCFADLQHKGDLLEDGTAAVLTIPQLLEQALGGNIVVANLGHKLVQVLHRGSVTSQGLEAIGPGQHSPTHQMGDRIQHQQNESLVCQTLASAEWLCYHDLNLGQMSVLRVIQEQVDVSSHSCA